jgi:DNA-directed RNA polymerase subunit RPC12/RpoP
MNIKLTPDYCCGGGHCGPMPGYYYKCPHCNEETSAKSFDSLKVGERLKCTICQGKIEAVTKNDEFDFEFKLIEWKAI